MFAEPGNSKLSLEGSFRTKDLPFPNGLFAGIKHIISFGKTTASLLYGRIRITQIIVGGYACTKVMLSASCLLASLP